MKHKWFPTLPAGIVYFSVWNKHTFRIDSIAFEFAPRYSSTFHIYTNHNYAQRKLVFGFCRQIFLAVRILPRHLVHQQSDEYNRLLSQNAFHRRVSIVR
ncbi:uncharacterized protein [Blastocystis hominis]|uniref:Uncharacterized protein n=1 Tax=Blastocystis hominis TaxID=12968 RepID=D8M370_BLAHO|nr:uncharacterized protein [Blastocystis hominis]CBK22343.2 unnamed protein product [Blastocystis hominis]|eukprot:XP_012896391.1 uncharacterized protein [Blastocystis hominis]